MHIGQNNYLISYKESERGKCYLLISLLNETVIIQYDLKKYIQLIGYRGKGTDLQREDVYLIPQNNYLSING